MTADVKLLADRIALLEGNHIMLDNPFTRAELLEVYKLALQSREAVGSELLKVESEAHQTETAARDAIIEWIAGQTKMRAGIGWCLTDVEIRALKESAAPQGTVLVKDGAAVREPAAAAPLWLRRSTTQGENMKGNVEQIARIAHEVNRAYCKALGDNSQPAWEDAPEWQRASAINGVNFHLDNPSASADHSHNAWLAEKEASGWKYGAVKDAEKKEHPCMVPFSELPVEQRAKDFLFRAVVHVTQLRLLSLAPNAASIKR